MTLETAQTHWDPWLRTVWVCVLVFFSVNTPIAGIAAEPPLPPAVQNVVERSITLLQGLVSDPQIIAAAKEESLEGMTNAKWDTLSDDEARVLAITHSNASNKLKEWETNYPYMDKIYVRNQNGSFVAGSRKALLYSIVKRPLFKAAIGGKVWHTSAVRPDPATQINSIQLGLPILDGTTVVGVLHTAIKISPAMLSEAH